MRARAPPELNDVLRPQLHVEVVGSVATGEVFFILGAQGLTDRFIDRLCLKLENGKNVKFYRNI